MKKFKEDPLFERAIIGNKLMPDRSSFKQLVKIKDLYQFGNSIFEIMVGKYEEGQLLKNFTDSENKQDNLETMGTDS